VRFTASFTLMPIYLIFIFLFPSFSFLPIFLSFFFFSFLFFLYYLSLTRACFHVRPHTPRSVYPSLESCLLPPRSRSELLLPAHHSITPNRSSTPGRAPLTSIPSLRACSSGWPLLSVSAIFSSSSRVSRKCPGESNNQYRSL